MSESYEEFAANLARRYEKATVILSSAGRLWVQAEAPNYRAGEEADAPPPGGNLIRYVDRDFNAGDRKGPERFLANLFGDGCQDDRGAL